MKPPFDPTKPFQSDSGDDGQPQASPAAPSGPGFVDKAEGYARSVLGGAEQGLTLGHGDEMDAGIEALKKKYLPQMLGGDPTAKSQPLVQVYRQERDKFRQQIGKEQEDNQGLFMGGQVAGSLLLPVPGGAAKTALGRIGQTALVGAGFGAANALGNAKELDSSAMQDAKNGAIAGGVIGGGASTVAELASKFLPSLLQRYAQSRALKATGAIKSDLKSNGVTPDKARQIGQYLLDNKLVRAFSNPEKTLDRVNAAKAEQGQQIGDLYDVADSLGGGKPFSATRFASRVQNGPLKNMNPAQATVARAPIQAIVDEIASRETTKGGVTSPYMMSLRKANEMESSLSNGIYNKMDPTEKTDALRSVRDILHDELHNQTAKVSPGIADRIKEADANYGPLATASKFGREAMTRQLGNRLGLAPSDLMLGVGTASGMMAHGRLLDGLAAIPVAYGYKLLREYGPSTLAVGANKLAGVLRSPKAAQLSEKYADKLAPSLSGLLSRTEHGDPPLVPAFASDDDDQERKARLAAVENYGR